MVCVWLQEDRRKIGGTDIDHEEDSTVFGPSGVPDHKVRASQCVTP